MDPFGHDRYLLRRKFFSFVHTNFFIEDASGAVVLYGRKKGFRMKEDIRLYEDAALSRELLSIQARSIIDFSATYDVTDSRTGTRVGVLRRKGLRSIIRDEWHILDPHERELAVIQEDSQAMALLRRFLTNLIPQSFHILSNNTPIAEIRQNFNPFLLRLVIDFTADPRRQLDRRLALAGASVLGTIEGRQSD